MIHRVFVTRQQTVFIFIEAASTSDIGEDCIQAAIEATVTEPEWTLDHIEHGSPVAVSADIAEGWPVYQVEAPPAQSLTSRAKAIGVSVVTLRKWRDERGVAVFDDEAVRRHIASQRNHSWTINPRFKPTL